MWFKRSNRNRRLSPGQKLEVKLSVEQARAANFKWAATRILGGIGTVFVLYLLWRLGGWSVDKFVYENPAFAIGQVVIQTDGSIPPEELRRWSGVKPGANLIALDTAAVKRNLELVSTIDSVSIERIPPRTLIIRVRERRAVAQVNQLRELPSGEMMVSVFQLDVNGHVMQPLGLSFLPLDRLKPQFPAIVGLNPVELQPGHPLTSSQGFAALALIAAFDKSTMIGRVDLQSVDVSEPGVLVVTSQAGGEVTFATDRLDQQMLRWRLAYDRFRSIGKTIASMDLSVSNDVPVKSYFTSAEPDSNQQLKHPHSRRKNV